MLKGVTSVGALTAVFIFGLTLGAPAQMMCSPGQQSQGAAMGGMCSMIGQAAPDHSTADKPAQKPEQSAMCPCCRNMGMMPGGMGGGGMQQNTPGMEGPKPQQ
jgi:hypothetical protein